MIKTILLLLLKNVIDTLKKDINNELMNLEDSVSLRKEKYEKLFEKDMLETTKKMERIKKTLEVLN